MTSHSHKFDPAELRLQPAVSFEVKATGNGVISGLASTFDGAPDAYGDVIQRGAFAASLGAHAAEGTLPAMLWQHNPAEPIGRWLEVRETAAGLEVKGAIDMNVQRGAEAFSLLKGGALRGLSIGYKVAEGGARMNGNVRELAAVDLWEISLVTFPANRKTRVLDVKAIGGVRSFEQALRDMGFPRAAATKLAAGGWSALAGSTIGETEARTIAAEIRDIAALFEK